MIVSRFQQITGGEEPKTMDGNKSEMGGKKIMTELR